MKRNIYEIKMTPLDVIGEAIRRCLQEEKYSCCERLIGEAMSQYPHMPQPHNWMGLLMERKKEHTLAMNLSLIHI